ncbi:MAG: chondroitinase-B domain-containing protein [Planctomycetota bacterium]
MKMLNEIRESFAKIVTLIAVVVVIAAAVSARERREVPPLVGFAVGPEMDEIVPKRFIVDPPTIENLGFRWYVEGDSNRNASVAVAFRKKGESEWTDALPMLRVHHEVSDQRYGPYRTGNLFAGSVLFLEPATAYEIRFTMSDPDGGAPAEPKIVEAATRAEPRAFEGGRIIDATAEKGLMAAFEQARPGDVIQLRPGIYKGPFELSKSGTAAKPIVFRGPPDGQAVLEADGVGGRSPIVTLNGANHLHFENLSFRNAHTAVYAAKPGGSDGLVIRRCKIHDVVYGINTGCENSKNWYIADNDIVGINPTWYPRPPDTYMSPGHTGVNVYGQGHIICYNRITRFSDSAAIYNFGPPGDDVSKHCVNIDFYNNDLSWAQDDTFEADYGCHNIRFYRNRCYNAHTGMSTQPFYGGPVYLIRNELYGITSLSYKLNNYPAGIEAYNNTSCCAGQGFRPPPIWQNGHFRNNLFMGASQYALVSGSPTPYSTMDYDAYRRNEAERLISWTGSEGKTSRYQSLEAFSKATGLERHGMLADYDIFVSAAPPEQGKSYEPAHYDLRLREAVKVVDAGITLAQITNGFTGKSPDLGCYELGQEPPHYGPRPLR